jgi:hypothetical protein
MAFLEEFVKSWLNAIGKDLKRLSFHPARDALHDTVTIGVYALASATDLRVSDISCDSRFTHVLLGTTVGLQNSGGAQALNWVRKMRAQETDEHHPPQQILAVQCAVDVENDRSEGTREKRNSHTVSNPDHHDIAGYCRTRRQRMGK